VTTRRQVTSAWPRVGSLPFIVVLGFLPLACESRDAAQSPAAAEPKDASLRSAPAKAATASALSSATRATPVQASSPVRVPQSVPELFHTPEELLSPEHALSVEELSDKTLPQLEFIQATIQARAGLVFLESWLRQYFEAQPWYEPGAYQPDRLGDTDKRNLALLQRTLETLPRRRLLGRWEELIGRYGHSSRHPQLQLSFSPDGRWLLSNQGPAWEGSIYQGGLHDGAYETPQLWDATTGALVRVMSWPKRFKAVMSGWHRDADFGKFTENWSFPIIAHRWVGQRLIVVTAIDVQIGSPRAKNPEQILPLAKDWGREGEYISSACIAPDGGALLVSPGKGGLRSYDLKRGILRSSFPDSYSCRFVNPEQAVLRRNEDGASFLWDAHEDALRPVELPKEGRHLAFGGGLLATGGKVPARPVRTPHHLGRSETAPPDITLWTLAGTSAEPRPLRGSASERPIVAFSPSGEALLVAQSDGLSLWDTRSLQQTRWQVPARHGYSIGGWGASFETESDLAYGAAEYTPVRLQGREGPSAPCAIAFSPDGQRVAVAWETGAIDLWDTASGRRVESFRGHEQWSEEAMVELSLLARRLGKQLKPAWRSRIRPPVTTQQLAALDVPLWPEVLHTDSYVATSERWQLRVLRNAVCARRGCALKSPLLQQVFRPLYEPRADYSSAQLTATDWANIAMLSAREKELGGSITDEEELRFRAVYGQQAEPDVVAAPPPPRRIGF